MFKLINWNYASLECLYFITCANSCRFKPERIPTKICMDLYGRAKMRAVNNTTKN